MKRPEMTEEMKEAKVLMNYADARIPQLSKWRHEKTGEDYTAVMLAYLESNLEPHVIYTGRGKDMFIRPTSEFLDGRFKRILDARAA